MRPADPCVGEVLSVGAAPFFNSAICVSSPELSPNPPGKAENGSDYTWVGLSQPMFRPTSKGSNLAVWVWSDCPTPVGSDCFNMKTFVGRIVTVPDGAGWSVTVSNWGVAQSSRHQTSQYAQVGTFAQTAIINYRLSFSDQRKKCFPFQSSANNGSCRFPFPFAVN